MNRDLSRRNKSRTLSTELAHLLADRIRSGEYPPGAKLPKEAAIMDEFRVSRTVVREAISYLQAVNMAETRHGIGTFALRAEEGAPFRVQPEQVGTLRDTIALLELRIGIETEAAAIAASRRTEANLQGMQDALAAFEAAIEAGQDAAATDFQFHREIALATQNNHFAEVMNSLGPGVIPRARLDPDEGHNPNRLAYLRRVHQEHESIFHAIRDQDVDGARAAIRTHLSNSRERLRRRDILPN
ncbi:FadR/GntR family transcriptional regulator [Hydrogenophaga sp.]|uniref:FadR/GntR family transcriptional regulator n=1 Tax=Hydrogenophaga sp. TaxID=1904254 RepID=UPI0026332E98|nr:FadR/GntR family transcriptional regulator [Hydrogenophaga sp.]MCW5652869.1 FadR family transcriptional regulator [Hydrogenophaga sp.]